MLDIKHFYNPYISDEEFTRLLKEAETADFNKSGGNSHCAIIDNYAVLKTGNIPGHDDSFPKMIHTLKDLKEKGINVVPILGYGVIKFGEEYNGKRYDKGYIIQEKAPGNELLYRTQLRDKSIEEQHDIVLNYIKTLNKISQKHFDKFVSDYKAITDQHVMIDPSKSSNFFYDSKQGFSFIDLNFFSTLPLFSRKDEDGNIHHAEFILYSLIPFNMFLSDYSPFFKYLNNYKEIELAQKVAIKCFNKNLLALKKLGVTEDDISYTIEKYNISLPKDLLINEIDTSLNN